MFHNPKEKKNPFKVPEGYFENLNSELMSRIEEQEVSGNKKTPVVPIRRRILNWSAVSAAAVAATFLIYNVSVMETVSVQEGEYAEERNEVVEEYYSFLESELDAISIDEYMYYQDDINLNE